MQINKFCVMKFISALALGFILCFIVSCTDQYTLCTLSKEIRFIGRFYQRISGQDVLAQAPGLIIHQLNVATPIFPLQQNVSTFSFPLNPLSTSASYIISVGNNQPQDTLTITYTSQGTNLSPECGSVIYHNITALSSTTHTIDSVKISNATVNTDPAENAKIYF